MKRLIRVAQNIDKSSEYIHGLPKVCRYCHHYCRDSQECLKMQFTIDTLGVYIVSESGRLSETLEEALIDESYVRSFYRSIFTIFDKWGLSKKRKQEFEKHFKECYEEFATVHMKEHLDSAVSLLYNTFGSDEVFAYISDPDTFCCKDWC